MDTIQHQKSCIPDTQHTFNTLKTEIQWTKHNYFKRSVAHYQFDIPSFNTLLFSLVVGREIKGVFLNLYENGLDFAPYHADRYNSDTILLSFGTTRVLRYKHNTTKENTDFLLENGDSLFVPDEINKDFKHSLLRTTKIDQPRISVLIFLV